MHRVTFTAPVTTAEFSLNHYLLTCIRHISVVIYMLILFLSVLFIMQLKIKCIVFPTVQSNKVADLPYAL